MWVDGPNRRPDEVESSVRSFVGKMQRRALEIQAPMWDEVEEELLVPDVGSRYAEVGVPTLVLVGSEDVSDMHEIADRLTSGIPGARKAVIARTAHVPSIERPHEFERLVLDFLSAS
jgi:3-oxoadipate enol-lactonase